MDVHDAKRIRVDAETRIAPYLDHSDLMVLDYHLAGDSNTGDASIKILRQLARNGHHNLVVLYTKGYQGDLRQVVREIAVALTFPDPALADRESALSRIADLVADWEDDHPGIRDQLMEQVSTDVYLRLRRRNSDYKKFLAGSMGDALKAQYAAKPPTLKFSIGELVEWLFLQRQLALTPQMSPVDLGPIETGEVQGQFWVRSDRLFVTAVPKADSATVFEERLAATLADCYQPPHQLLLAKMRGELDEQGSRAEISILNNRAVQTAWLEEFMNPEAADEGSAIHGAINRHWEALGDSLRNNLEVFGRQLRSAFVGTDPASLFERCGLRRQDLDNEETMLAYNHFVSTKSFDRSHLTTGHVFRIPFGPAAVEHEYWVCLTPACDLVPGQKTNGWNSRLGTSVPFNAFRLVPTGARRSVDNATSNNYVFLLVDGKPASFSIYPDGNSGSSPEWEQMLANNHGRFKEERKLGLTRTAFGTERVEVVEVTAEVVAQLRTEYALSLLQRASAFLSRPGLGMHFRARG